MHNLLHCYIISKQIGFTSRPLEQENILSIGLDSPVAQIRSYSISKQIGFTSRPLEQEDTLGLSSPVAQIRDYSNEQIEPKSTFSAEEVLGKERS